MATKLQDVDTHCVTDDSLPWLPLDPNADLVAVKILAVDPVRGEVIMVLRAAPGAQLPRHRTSTATTIYTLQGRWRFREHDWVAGPGSLVIEPASSCHTLQVLADGTDDAIMFIRATGELQLFDNGGKLVCSENWRTAVNRYHDYCRAHDIEPSDVATWAYAADPPAPNNP